MPGGGGRNGGRDSTAQAVYLRVVGLIQENDAHGPAVRYTPAEEEAFTRLAARPDVYEILLRSTAPNISGSYTVDIKKAMLCQLMGGSSKRLPDGMRLRGTYTCVGRPGVDEPFVFSSAGVVHACKDTSHPTSPLWRFFSLHTQCTHDSRY
jgi:DNA replicative helicase MCM subunit Mcm2 (Cdc46/Mcm family)